MDGITCSVHASYCVILTVPCSTVPISIQQAKYGIYYAVLLSVFLKRYQINCDLKQNYENYLCIFVRPVAEKLKLSFPLNIALGRCIRCGISWNYPLNMFSSYRGCYYGIGTGAEFLKTVWNFSYRKVLPLQRPCFLSIMIRPRYASDEQKRDPLLFLIGVWHGLVVGHYRVVRPRSIWVTTHHRCTVYNIGVKTCLYIWVTTHHRCTL